MYYGERRKEWDTQFKSYSLPLGGDPFRDEECVLDYEVDLGTLVHMVGFPRRIIVKVRKRHDYPQPGMMTFASFGLDVEGKCRDVSSKLGGQKTGTIMPHPQDPSKCIVHSLALSNTGGLPKWGLKMLMSTMAPQMIKGMQVGHRHAWLRARLHGLPPCLRAAPDP